MSGSNSTETTTQVDPNPAVELTSTPVATETTQTTEPPAVVVEPPAVEPKVNPLAPAWARQRIDELTGRYRSEEARRAEVERERDALKAQIAQFQIGGGTTTTQPPAAQTPHHPTAPQAAPFDLDAQVNARAAEMQFTKDCNAVAQKGQEEFKDFSDVLKNYGMLGGLTPQFLEAVLAQDSPHTVLYELGKNPEEAQKLLGMSGPRLGASLTRFSTTLAKPAQTTRAPAPITPVVGGTAKTGDIRLDDDSTSMSKWIEKRNADLKGKRKA